MGKRVDITSKLNFEENPKIVISGKEMEINADAATVLKVMGSLGEGAGPKQIVDMYNLIFPAASRKTMESLKLNFNDFTTVVEKALDLIVGNDEDQEGEAETHTTI